MDDIYTRWLEDYEDSNKAEDEAKKTAAAFRSIFKTEEGKLVLQALLNKLKFLEQCHNEQDMALNNFAKDLVITVFWDTEIKGFSTNRLFNFIKRMLRKTKNGKN